MTEILCLKGKKSNVIKTYLKYATLKKIFSAVQTFYELGCTVEEDISAPNRSHIDLIPLKSVLLKRTMIKDDKSLKYLKVRTSH